MAGVPGMRDGLPSWAPELRPCGTPAAWRRHWRHGEPLCDWCRETYNEHHRRYRRVRGRTRTHLADGDGTACRRWDHLTPHATADPGQVTCRYCLTVMPAQDLAA